MFEILTFSFILDSNMYTFNRLFIYFLSFHLFCLRLQWECKTDMDSRYRFGEISVSCEGYDYPDDPYVLKGSCGVCTNSKLNAVQIRLVNNIINVECYVLEYAVRDL